MTKTAKPQTPSLDFYLDGFGFDPFTYRETGEVTDRGEPIYRLSAWRRDDDPWAAGHVDKADPARPAVLDQDIDGASVHIYAEGTFEDAAFELLAKAYAARDTDCFKGWGPAYPDI